MWDGEQKGQHLLQQLRRERIPASVRELRHGVRRQLLPQLRGESGTTRPAGPRDATNGAAKEESHLWASIAMDILLAHHGDHRHLAVPAAEDALEDRPDRADRPRLRLVLPTERE